MIVATWLTKKPSASAWFIAVGSTFILFLASIFYWSDTLYASSWMPASHNDVFIHKAYWKLWTTLFAHADFGHLLSNSILFVVLGYFLSGYFGAGIFPTLAIFMGGLINLAVLSQYHGDIHLIGMSGVVYWMGGAWLVLYLLLDEQRRLTQRLLRAMGVALGVFMPSAAFDPQISYGAHLVGFIFGVVAGALYYISRRRSFQEAIIQVESAEDTETLRTSNTEAEDGAIPLGPPRI